MNRAALAQEVIGARHVAMTSNIGGGERLYEIGISDAYHTRLHSLDGCVTTSVGTRALLDHFRQGWARPFSPVRS